MSTQGWSIPQDAEDYLRRLEKRLARLERHQGGGTSINEVLGPGMASQAVQIIDWSSRDALLNGFYHSTPGAVNSPDPLLSWTGQVIAKDDGTGMQQVWNTNGPTTLYWMRTYAPTPTNDGNVLFSVWKRFATESGYIGLDELDTEVTDAIESGGAPVAPVAPEFRVVGMPRGLMVQVKNGLPGWTYTYTITNHTTEDDPDITASYPDTKQPIIYVEEMPDGTPFDPNSTGYSFTITATNEAGQATSPASAPQALVLNDSTTIAELVVDKLISGEGTFGSLTGAFALFGSLQVGTSISLSDDEGIVIETPLGPMVLPADGSSPQFKGEAEFDRLTVLGNLAIRGTSNEVAKGASIQLSTVIQPPKSSPVIQYGYDTHAIHEGYSPWGFDFHPGANAYLAAETIMGATLTKTRPNVTTGQYDWVGNFSMSGARPEIMGSVGGVCVNPTNNVTYTLSSAQLQFSWEWRIYRWTWNGTTWVYDRHMVYEPENFLGRGSTHKPSIAWDSATGRVAVLQAGSGSGGLHVTRYDAATLAFVNRGRLYDEFGEYMLRTSDIKAAVFTAADVGEHRLWVCFSDAQVYSFDPDAGNLHYHERGADQFPTISDIRGLYWNATAGAFRSRAGGTVTDHTAINTSIIGAVQTYRKADATAPDFAQYETSMSELAFTQTFRKRAKLALDSGPIPNTNEADTPDAVTFYVAAGNANPGWADLRRQPPPAVGVTHVSYSTIDTGSAASPPEGNFPSSGTAAQIVSAAIYGGTAAIRLSGDGAWKLGPISGDINGNLTGAAFIPIGGMIPFAGNSPPAGFLWCDGSTFSDTIFPQLAAVLGDRWGNHSGNLYFLPDTRRRAVVGTDGSATPVGDSDGIATVADRTPYHNHGPGNLSTGGPVGTAGRADGGLNTANPQHSHNVTGGETGNALGWNSVDPSDRFPYAAALYIIRAA